VKKGDIVYVEWRDICTHLSEDGFPDALDAVAVGRVVKQNRATLWLASGWYKKEKEWPSKDLITLPKGCIMKVEVLR